MGLVLCVIGWLICAGLLLAFVFRDSPFSSSGNLLKKKPSAVSVQENSGSGGEDFEARSLPPNEGVGKNEDWRRENRRRDPVPHSPRPRPGRGRRRAVVFGLNYKGKDYELFGCIADALNMQKLLLGPYAYDEVLLMTDDTPTKPTRANMIKAMGWLVQDVQANDSLALHYSGHGDVRRSREPGAKRGDVDDTIVPLDWEQTGQLIDDELHELLVEPLRNVRACLTVIFDCCHSGTGLDLKFNYRVDRNRIKQMPDDPRPPVAADVVLYSASLDNETADDTTDARGLSYGAMTNSLLTVLQRVNYTITCGALLLQMQHQLRITSSQNLQLSSEKKLNLDAPFTFGCATTTRSA